MTGTWSEFETAFHDHYTTDPNRCVMLGVDRRLDELRDPTLVWSERQVDEARRLLAQADTLDESGLDFDRRIDLALARQTLEREVHERTLTFNGRLDAQQRPTAGDDIGGGIDMMLLNDPRPAAERLADITARLEQVPDHLPALLARLDRPVTRWVAVDLEEIEALPGLFATLRDWAQREGWPDASRLAAATAAAESALVTYARGLRALPTEPALHVAEDDARRLLGLRGIDLPLEQLHVIARDFLAEMGDTIETLRCTLASRYDLDASTTADELQSFLNERFAVGAGPDRAAQILDRYETANTRILEFITARDLFPLPDDHAIRIIRTPGFLEPTIPAGAMNPPPPFRAGTRTSLVFLTLPEVLLDEHNELNIDGMMIHEGTPGHHLQLAWAADNPSVVRRHLWYADLGEGWTTMLEDYMVDEGFFGDLADEARFFARRGISRLGARVAIDLFLMTGDRGYLDVGIDCDIDAADPFTAAGNLLAAATGFPAARVKGELNWYSLERGLPLSYLTGNHLVWALKRDVIGHAASTGGPTGHDLDRRFHRVFLEAGNMPVSLLRRVCAERGLLPGSGNQ